MTFDYTGGNGSVLRVVHRLHERTASRCKYPFMLCATYFQYNSNEFQFMREPTLCLAHGSGQENGYSRVSQACWLAKASSALSDPPHESDVS